MRFSLTARVAGPFAVAVAPRVPCLLVATMNLVSKGTRGDGGAKADPQTGGVKNRTVKRNGKPDRRIVLFSYRHNPCLFNPYPRFNNFLHKRVCFVKFLA